MIEAVTEDTKEVASALTFDLGPLADWMAQNVSGFNGPLSMRQFKGGQSNPTYRLTTPARAYVLRRKPPGKLLPSAHAVEREFAVISGLYPTGFPVAEPLGLCEDENVIGTSFYVMADVRGRIFWNGALPDVSHEDRRAIYLAKIRTLAALHNVDYVKTGLSDFGKPGNYYGRQIGRWSKQYQLSETQKIKEMDALIDFLPQTLPENEATSIVHGDYRLDNMIWHPEKNEILAVLDWELSTLGDPLADLTYYLMAWVMPNSLRAGLKGLDLAGLNIPSRQEAMDIYCQETGREKIENPDWYFAYNLFRLAAIIQGIAGRVRDGTAASAEAAEMAKAVVPLAEVAYEFALKAGMVGK